jgi:hypothetical protein
VSDGNVIVADIEIDVPAPRRRRDPRFAELRRTLLGHLGVADDEELEPATTLSAPDAHGRIVTPPSMTPQVVGKAVLGWVVRR